MLLRVPAGDVPHVAAAERHRPVEVAIAPVERTEALAPLRGREQAIGVVERVPGLVPQVHHDLARVLEIVHLAFEAGELGIREVERDPDHGLAVGAAPLVGEIAHRMKRPESLAVELAVELLDEALDRRALDSQAELADPPAEQVADLGRGLLERAHGRHATGVTARATSGRRGVRPPGNPVKPSQILTAVGTAGGSRAIRSRTTLEPWGRPC